MFTKKQNINSYPSIQSSIEKQKIQQGIVIYFYINRLNRIIKKIYAKNNWLQLNFLQRINLSSQQKPKQRNIIIKKLIYKKIERFNKQEKLKQIQVFKRLKQKQKAKRYQEIYKALHFNLKYIQNKYSNLAYIFRILRKNSSRKSSISKDQAQKLTTINRLLTIKCILKIIQNIYDKNLSLSFIKISMKDKYVLNQKPSQEKIIKRIVFFTQKNILKAFNKLKIINVTKNEDSLNVSLNILKCICYLSSRTAQKNKRRMIEQQKRNKYKILSIILNKQKRKQKYNTRLFFRNWRKNLTIYKIIIQDKILELQQIRQRIIDNYN